MQRLPVWDFDPSEELSKCISAKCCPDVCWVGDVNRAANQLLLDPTLKDFNPQGGVLAPLRLL